MRNRARRKLLPPKFQTIQQQFQILHALLEAAEDRDPLSEEMFHCLLKLVMSQLLLLRDQPEGSAFSKHRQVLRKLTDYINQHISHPIAFEELAGFISLSPRYISRLFKKHMGVSLKEYIKQTRLERARQLLSETTMNVSQVTEALGYSDIYFFSKQFKKQYSVPPSANKRHTRPAKLEK